MKHPLATSRPFPSVIPPHAAAFTLIELLVVLAITSMLSSLLFTALKTAREKGRQIACMNNLRQIYLGMRSYADDNNGIYLGYGMTTKPAGVNYDSWGGVLTGLGYVKGKLAMPKPWTSINMSTTFFCPSDKLVAPNYEGRNGVTSYGLNSSWEPASYGDSYWRFENDRFVDSRILDMHSVKVMIAEADRSIASEGRGLVRKTNFWTGHGGVGNILFTDGHIEVSEFDPTGVAAKSQRYIWSYYFDNAW
ncbi:MAG: prepilin-type N-terminal cleavage/methylation domain-containing protein [Verrucomicrobiae bacterium]|nr:prepilin-type N-terminal cleavage/methylation domain-containing protein [Verrucomicrobiae bacterium]